MKLLSQVTVAIARVAKDIRAVRSELSTKSDKGHKHQLNEVDGIDEALGGIVIPEIDDAVVGEEKLWSSQKVSEELSQKAPSSVEVEPHGSMSMEDIARMAGRAGLLNVFAESGEPPTDGEWLKGDVWIGVDSGSVWQWEPEEGWVEASGLGQIDDLGTFSDKVWSSQKVSGELSWKADLVEGKVPLKQLPQTYPLAESVDSSKLSPEVLAAVNKANNASPVLNDKGAWQANVSYGVGDVVHYAHQRWYCRTAHVGASSFDTSRWVFLGNHIIIASTDPGGGQLWIKV